MTEFTKLGLSPAALEAVAATGYVEATPIQAQAIPVALAGRDVLGIAQTGTGKTAAFTLPMVDRLAAGRAKARMPRSLVVAPTRELADQVAASFERYSKGQKLSWALLIGGVSFGDQEAKLDRGVDVLIATPGRLLDHFERGKLLLTGVQILVVDEADRMLDMGFIPDIERIFKLTPPRKQTLFFSATMPPEITRLTKQFLKDPERIRRRKVSRLSCDSRPDLARSWVVVATVVAGFATSTRTGLCRNCSVMRRISGGMVAVKNKVWRVKGTSLQMRSMSGMKPMSSMRSASSMTRSSTPVSRSRPRSK